MKASLSTNKKLTTEVEVKITNCFISQQMKRLLNTISIPIDERVECKKISLGIQTMIQNPTTIIKELSPTRLPALQEIRLGCNAIHSLEALAQVWIPYLKKMLAVSGRITCIRPIRKCYWPCLVYLSLSRHGLNRQQLHLRMGCFEGSADQGDYRNIHRSHRFRQIPQLRVLI